jgi:ADP-dependent NAD(P)H-hydrate dehydratase / NAD(P)H-hydrate epimerase
MKILTAAQMGEVDRLTTAVYNIPSLLLMENAGRAVADELARSVPDLERKRVLVICGRGNNGGDGFVVARYLHLRGVRPEIILCADPAKIRGDALTNWEIVRALGIPIHVASPESGCGTLLDGLPPQDVIIDALFGTGLTKPIGAEFLPVVEWINRFRHNAFVASVDIPSGLFADSPDVPGPFVMAHLTVTFTALKPALVLPPAVDCAGRIVVADIGSPADLVAKPEHQLNLVDERLAGIALPPRPRDSHKGAYGHLYLVAGSRGKSGAALMAGLSALRSGAGLVTVFLPESLQHDVVGKVPELMTESLPETDEGTADQSGVARVLEALALADALAVGPGMTVNPSTQGLIRDLVRRSPVPIVLDADGLNAFAGQSGTMRNENGQPVIITPHPGEMARLLGTSISEVQKDRLRTARDFAASRGCYVVLKGAQTVASAPAGDTFVNSTGNPGMATGGSGDILTGIVGCFVAVWKRRFQSSDSLKLAEYISAAVYIHGLAGDLAAAEKGVESMIATDLLPHLSAALKRVSAPE